jgi:DNA-binding CsgD family transcriptional regulator
MPTVTEGEVVATLSLAADLGFGLPLESGLVVSAVALDVGERMGLDAAELDRVHLLALLRHIGCTANSDEAAAFSTDEITLRRTAPLLDLANKPALLPHMLRLISATTPPAGRPKALLRMLATAGSAAAASAAAVCEAATVLAGRIGIGAETIADLNVYYERWDGKGLIGTASGDEIPAPVQAVQVAESAHGHALAGGVDAAAAFVRRHAGTLFAPPAARAFLDAPPDVLAAGDAPGLWEAALARLPSPLPAERLDATFDVVADFADLRSVWLGGHSRGVAALAAEAGRLSGLPVSDIESLRRAGLVHDLGRVAVSARVWGKQGPLTTAEWDDVRLHPYHVERVLARVEALAPLGRLASFHHERCDGSGYFRGTRELSSPARLLAAADALHAMTEARPHRPARSLEAAAVELRAGVRAGRFDGDAAECALAAAGAGGRRRELPGGLSPREVEVLRLLARGCTKRQVAAELVIAPKTADAHVQHIYSKLGVSTRAGATLFAMQHGLLDSLAS